MDKSLSTFAKLLLIGAGGLAVVAGPVLFLFPGNTASYFAWAIKNPLTPVFMGANYFGGIGAIWAMRSNRWSVARVLLPGIIVFAITQLLATLLHVPIFNWSHPIAWAWLIVYITSPVATMIVWAQMERHYQPPAIQHPLLTRGFQPLILIFATINGIVGLALWLWPAIVPASAVLGAVPWWAWSLTPLTARVIGGWYLASTALFVTLSRTHPFEAVRVALLGVMCATGLELLGAVLHTKSFNGPMFMIGLYLLNAAVVLGFALFTWFRMARVAPVTAA
jgi:hypothetical protein